MARCAACAVLGVLWAVVSIEAKKKVSSLDPVGVAFTRTEVRVQSEALIAEDFSEVYASLLTLRAGNPDVPCALFTDAPAKTVSYAFRKLGATAFARSTAQLGGTPTFDFVLPAAPGEDIARRVLEQRAATFGGSDDSDSFSSSSSSRSDKDEEPKAVAILRDAFAPRDAHRAGLTIWTKMKALVSRIDNLKRSPFVLTLFLDTDTALCPSPDLAAALEAIDAARTRFPNTIGATPYDLRVPELHACKGRDRFLAEALAAERRVFDVFSPPASALNTLVSLKKKTQMRENDDTALVIRLRDTRAQECAATACPECLSGWTSELNVACYACAVSCEPVRAEREADRAPLGSSPCAAFQENPPHLQVGAMLARRGPRFDDLVDAWLRAYFDVFALADASANVSLAGHPVAKNTYGNDQVPLDEVLMRGFCEDDPENDGDNAAPPHHRANWTVGHLFPSFNFRMLDDDAAGPVVGRVFVLHGHGVSNYDNRGKAGTLKTVKRICDALNPEDGLGLRIVRNTKITPDAVTVDLEHVRFDTSASSLS